MSCFPREYLELEITPSQERVHEIVDQLLVHLNCTLNKVKSVLLVEDLIDSLKVWLLCMFVGLNNESTLFSLVFAYLLVAHLHRGLVQWSHTGHPRLHWCILAAQGVRVEQESN